MTSGPLIIVSGPSGSGKSTLIDHLLKEKRWPLRLSVSATTRGPRPGEQSEVDYHYWTTEAFLAEVRSDGFLEWAEVFGNYYGTLEREVEPYRRQGIGVVLDIDVQGWQQVTKRCPEAVSIFVRTSSMDTLEKRLRDRKTETTEVILQRLAGAKLELAHAPDYDFQLINDDLNTALADLRTIVGPLFERQTDA